MGVEAGGDPERVVLRGTETLSLGLLEADDPPRILDQHFLSLADRHIKWPLHGLRVNMILAYLLEPTYLPTYYLPR